MKQTVTTDLSLINNILGENSAKRLLSNRNICHCNPDGGYILSFYYCDSDKLSEDNERITIYFDKIQIIFVCTNSQLTAFLDSMPEEWDIPKRLFEFFAYITETDFSNLEIIEEKIIEIEDQVSNAGKISSLEKDTMQTLHDIRNQLLIVKRYYSQLGIITYDLAGDEGDYFTPEEEKHIKFIDKRLDRLLETTLHLQEYSNQVREEYQAKLASEQNDIISKITVITTIFLPLSFIATWYGMNFRMPELEWDISYPIITIGCLILSLVMMIIFKRKKWF